MDGRSKRMDSSIYLCVRGLEDIGLTFHIESALASAAPGGQTSASYRVLRSRLSLPPNRLIFTDLTCPDSSPRPSPPVFYPLPYHYPRTYPDPSLNS